MGFYLMTQRKLDKIEECYRGSYDNGLTHLKAINAGEYINGIGAEYSELAHEQIVEYACSKGFQYLEVCTICIPPQYLPMLTEVPKKRRAKLGIMTVVEL